MAKYNFKLKVVISYLNGEVLSFSISNRPNLKSINEYIYCYNKRIKKN